MFKILSSALSKSSSKISAYTHRHSQSRKIVSSVFSQDTRVHSSYKDLDISRYGDFLIGLFSKKIKLYNAYSPNLNKVSDYITCYLDELRNLLKFTVFDRQNKTIKVFDKQGKLKIFYDKDETNALFNYKHSSKIFHKLLRYNGASKKSEEFYKYIEVLANLFKKGKTSKAESDFYVYRVLDKKSLKLIKNILAQNSEGVFTDTSFISTTKKKSALSQFLNFKNRKYVLRIKIPKGTQYIDLDEVGQSVVWQIPEYELLFNKGSSFLIKGKNKNSNLIDAEYIPEKKGTV